MEQLTIGLFIISTLTVMVLAVAFIFAVNGQRKIRERLRQSEQQLKMEDAWSDRLSRDIHDQIAQELVALGIRIRNMETKDEEGEDISEDSDICIDIIQKLSIEVNSLNFAMDVSLNKTIGLAELLWEEADYIWRRYRIKIDLKATDYQADDRIDARKRFLIYRMVREAMRNASKHAGVREFIVKVWNTETQLHIAVVDQGNGYIGERIRGTLTTGIRFMHTVADYLNGELVVNSKQGVGTTLDFIMPL